MTKVIAMPKVFTKPGVIAGVLILSSLLSGAWAQPAGNGTASRAGEIHGRVLDAEKQVPLAWVNVVVEGTSLGTATGTDGSFVITGVPEGEYRLILSRLGYEALAVPNLVLAAGQRFARDFFLRESYLEGDEITVTAARKEQTAHMAPASVATLDALQIRQRNVTTFDQALASTQGISVFRSAGTTVQSVSIRGSSDVAGGGVGNRVLLLIDGRPALTSDSGGALWSLVPLNFVDRIEIVKGAFSSLYGSTAMGGVVNVITRRPNYARKTHVEASYGFYELPPMELRHTDTPGTLSALAFNHSGRYKRVSYLLNLSRKQSDGFRERSAYEFYDLYSKLLVDFRQNRNFEVSVGGTLSKNDYPHTWLSNLQPFRVAPHYQDDRQVKRALNADFYYWAVPNARVKYGSRFYFYRNAARSYFNEDDPFRQIPHNEPYGLRTIVDADKFGNLTQVDWQVSESHDLILGLDAQIDHVVSSPDSIMYGNQQVNNFAVYAQDEVRVTPRLTLTTGARLDYNILVGGKRQNQVSPKIGLVYHLTEHTSLRGLAGQAFRAPSIAERFFRKEISGGTSFVPNPNLQAERVNSFEVGGRSQFGTWLDVDLALFHYRYRDMIYWVSLPQQPGQFEPMFQVRNLNRALMQGVEVGANFYLQRRLRLRAGYTYLDAVDRSADRTDDLLAYRVRHALNFGGTFSWKKYELNLDGRYNGRVEEVFLYPNDEPKAYWLLNTKLVAGLMKGAAVTLSCNNLLNSQFEELARYRMPGRHWIAGLSYEF